MEESGRFRSVYMRIFVTDKEEDREKGDVRRLGAYAAP
jgi:hypothetical protein